MAGLRANHWGGVHRIGCGKKKEKEFTQRTQRHREEGKSRFLPSLGMTNSGGVRRGGVWGGVWLGEGDDEGVDAEGGAQGKVVERKEGSD